MATNNFHNVNASRIFSCISENEDEFYYEDTKDNILYEMSKDKMFCDANDEYINWLRSFEGSSIGSLQVDGEIEIVALTRNGYYEGFNLDWQIVGSNGEIESIEDAIEELKEQNQEHIEQYSEPCYELRGIRRKIESAIIKIEKIFTSHSDPIDKIGTMSNGVAIYV